MHDKVVDHIPRLRRYARALMRGDTLAADDLVQDCLERALSRLHLWRRGSDLRAWLFTIMHNLYVNQVRRAVNGPAFVEFADNDSLAAARTNESEIKVSEMQDAINTLPHDQREIILLVGLEGMRYHEVASILSIPEGTVMSRLSRARQQLRTVLGHENSSTIRRVK